MPYRGLILFAACALVACASGPHPALQVASTDLDCEQSGMKVHQIYPKKVRVEGCDQEAIYVDACNGYGVDAQCGWGRQYATDFERDAARRAKIERAEAKKQQAQDQKIEAEQEAAEREAAEQEAADKEMATATEAEQQTAEPEKVTANEPVEEEPAGDEAKPQADAKKPRAKSAKRGKAAKKSEGIDDFLK